MEIVIRFSQPQPEKKDKTKAGIEPPECRFIVEGFGQVFVGKKKFSQSLEISIVIIDKKPFGEQIDDQLVIFSWTCFPYLRGYQRLPGNTDGLHQENIG